MAVQIPDPGQGDNKTGDNEYVFRKKVQNNFSDPNNAASRKVGTSSGNLLEVGAFGLARVQAVTPVEQSLFSQSWAGFSSLSGNYPDSPTGAFIVGNRISINHPFNDGERLRSQMVFAVSGDVYAGVKSGSDAHVWAKLYSDKNTTLDSNGALKPSSPVLRVFNDHIEGNTDGDTMAATYTKNGVGDYTITGTTGLRTDGWYIVVPNDINGNPKVAVTLDDTDGVITLKTYARVFDMATFKFVPDLNQPLDIPDGRWIDLRFNDLPAESMPPEV